MKANPIRSEQTKLICDKLDRERFYGSVTLHFENGKIYRIEKLENIMSKDVEPLINA